MTDPTYPARTNPAVANLRDAFAAILRRGVAATIGGFLTYLLTKYGINVDPETATGLIIGLTGLVVTLYGAVVNVLEVKVPKLGWFLGLARQPKFITAPSQSAPTGQTLDGTVVVERSV